MDYLKQNNISFTDKNVNNDKEAAREMIQKSGQKGVPVIDIDGNIIVGFDKESIDKYLGL